MIGLMSNSQFNYVANLYTHMHGLIFETSIWLLAGSTRFKYNPVCFLRMTYAIHIHAIYVRMLSMSHNQTCAMRGEAPTKLCSTSTLFAQYLKHNIAHIVTIEHLLIIYHISPQPNIAVIQLYIGFLFWGTSHRLVRPASFCNCYN